MISTSSELASIIRAGGYQSIFLADVIVDGVRVLQDLPLPSDSFQITQDGNARIRTQGKATVVYSDSLGSSISPDSVTAWFTPYVTYLNIVQLIAVDGFSERIQIGYLKLVGVGNLNESKVNVAALNRIITIGSTLDLTLADAFEVTDRELFPTNASPTNANAWDEIAALTLLGVVRNVSDVAIPSTIAYDNNRLDAVIALGTVLGGIPYINPAGQITLQPDAWGATQEPLTIGPTGTIVQVSASDTTDANIYNQVVASGTAADQTPIYVHAELTTGPLRYGGPFGRIPYVATLPATATTTTLAQAYVNSLLPLVSTTPALVFQVTCVPDPRREVGDVVTFQKLGQTYTGRITKKVLSGAAAMVLTIVVNSA